MKQRFDAIGPGAAGAAAISIAIAMLYPASAVAQAARAADRPAEQSESAGDIVVTGSRIDRAGFDAPTPTTVLTATDLTRGARPNLAESLNDLPQFRIAGSPVTTPASGQSSASSIDLRSLGIVRTLTLLNGRRFIGSGELTSLPQPLIQKVDIVTGGASAAWGSGAVAGVVNIILDDKLEGLRLGLNSGISSRQDAGRIGADAAYGASFGDGRGHITVAGGYEVGHGAFGRNSGSRPNLDSALFQTTSGQLILANDVNFIDATPGGVIRSGALAGLAFNPDGTLSPVRLGSQTNANSTIGGNSRSLFDYIAVSSPYERINGYGRISYDVAPDINVWADAIYSKFSSKNRPSIGESLRASATSGGVEIASDNPFLRPEIRAQLAGGPATFRLGRIIGDAGSLGFLHQSGIRESIDAAVGVDGRFGDSWRFSVYFGHGELRNNDFTLNQRIVSNFANAVDAVVNPATNQIVCRIALTDPNTACRPLNLFGQGNISADAAAYAMGDAWSRTLTKLDTGGVSLRGEPFATWAGDVSIAIGAEARRESLRTTVDALSRSSGFGSVNYGPLAGAFDVKEAFGEILVPILKAEGVAEIELNGAARYSDYSNSGGIWTWKGGATVRLVNDILFRAVTSQDIRSPGIGELFATQGSGLFNVSDPANGNAVVSIRRFTGGNPDLTPEIARTTTLGVSASPSFVPGLRLSVDYWDIRIRDVIGGLSAQDIVTQCFRGNQTLCAAVNRDPSGALVSVFAGTLNLASYKTRGVDFELSYAKRFGEDDGLSVRGLATYVDRLRINDGVNTYDRAGDVGEVGFATPKWRATGTISYRHKDVNLDLRGRYVGGGKYNSLLPILNNDIGGRLYIDAGLGIDIGNLTLSANVANLFDRDPPFVNYASSIYDVIGRYYTMTARVKF